MSGGSLDYVFGRVEDAANTIESRYPKSPLHLAFAEHLRKVAKALHATEWVMSCDWGDGDEDAAIRAVIQPSDELEEAIRIADSAKDALDYVIQRAKESRK